MVTSHCCHLVSTLCWCCVRKLRDNARNGTASLSAVRSWSGFRSAKLKASNMPSYPTIPRVGQELNRSAMLIIASCHTFPEVIGPLPGFQAQDGCTEELTRDADRTFSRRLLAVHSGSSRRQRQCADSIVLVCYYYIRTHKDWSSPRQDLRRGKHMSTYDPETRSKRLDATT